MDNHTVFTLASGVFLLLYGVNLAGEGFQRAAGPKLRNILYYVTGNRFLGASTGALVTAIIQSSSATTVMLIGFVSSGLINLGQAIGVILGANIGTTFTVQLIAFRIYDYAIFMVGAGAVLLLFAKRKKLSFIGQGILGFAFVFLAMKIMSDAMTPLKNSALFKDLLLSMRSNYLGLLIASSLFTAVVQSSAATIGIALALSIQGLMDIKEAIPLIFGANLGTCATALIASMKSTSQARRVAVAHTLFNFLGVVIFLPLITPFERLVVFTSSEAARQIANAHSLFNIMVAVIFLPATKYIARIVERMVPEAKTEKERFRPKYLNTQVLGSPDMAFGLAAREALRMADITQDMYEKSIQVLVRDDQELLEEVEDMDDKLDMLDREIKLYITKISQKVLTEEESKREIALLSLVNDMENIGDIIDKNIMELAKKKIANGLKFSGEGEKEIVDFHSRIGSNFEMAVSAFTMSDPDLAWKVLKNKEKLGSLERELKAAHIGRLHRGLKESIDTSSIHLDLLSNLKRINHHITNISYPIIRNREESGK